MKRYLAIDTLRGLILVLMALYHFGGPLKRIANQPLGFVSVAEGFVFISGIIYGIVYGKYFKDSKKIITKSFSRAFHIYKYHIALLIFVFILSAVMRMLFAKNYFGPDALFSNPIGTIFSSLILLYQPWMLDILPMFIVFSLVGPFLVTMYMQGKGKYFILISFLFWLAIQSNSAQYYYYKFIDTYAYIDLGYFNIIAWQIVFFIGVYLGLMITNGREKKYIFNNYALMPMLLIFIVLFMLRHGLITIDLIDIESATDGKTLAWLRLANLLIVVYVISWLINRKIIRNINWLSFLGQHSLQVFVFHVYLLYFINPWKWRIQELGKTPMLISSIIFILLLYLPAYFHRNYQVKRLHITKRG